MFKAFPIYVIIGIVVNIKCNNDVEISGSIADAVRKGTEVNDEAINQFQLCKHPLSGRHRNNQPTKTFQNDTFHGTVYLGNLGCRLREHKDCNSETLHCKDQCLNGFVFNEMGICQIFQTSELENKEFMPTEELDKVWAVNDKKSIKQDFNKANEAVSFTVSTRMTLQKVVHRKGQDHIDKLKQLGEILTSKQHNRGEDEIDVSPPDVHPSPEQASSYTPSHSPHEVKRSGDLGTKFVTLDLGTPLVVNINEGKWMFYIVLAGCVTAALFGLIIAATCWYRLQKNMKATSDADYPSYGVTGTMKSTPPTADEVNAMASPTCGAMADRKLAQSAQMYHYQHQKQQMLNVEKAQNNFNKNQSDSEDENEDGDYTVYECPGLAPTGEMEVNNPLFGGNLGSESTMDGRVDSDQKTLTTSSNAK